MGAFIVTIHIIACIVLIVLVLLQSGKEGMGVIFGGGSGSVFGSAGAGGFLVKLTAWFAALFLISCLAYNYTTMSRNASSVMKGVTVEQKAAPVENKPKPTLFEEQKPKDEQTPGQTPAAAQEQKPAVQAPATAPEQERKPAQTPAQTPGQTPAQGQKK